MKNMAIQNNQKTLGSAEAVVGTPCPASPLFCGAFSFGEGAGAATLGEIVRINTKAAAAQVQSSVFAHDVLNQIAKYRIRLYRAGR